MVEKVITTAIPLDDLAQLDPEFQYEVVDGRLVEAAMSPSYMHVLLIEALYDILKPFVKQHDLGRVHTDGLMYVLHVNEAGVRYARIPDLSFIRKDAIPAEFDVSKPFPGAPTLAVEIVSPNERPDSVYGKLRDYIAYGTEQVWVLYPTPQQIAVFTQDVEHPNAIYSVNDVIPTDTLFPGLALPVADIFAPLNQA
jgi:Uma2 family endonuclease